MSIGSIAKSVIDTVGEGFEAALGAGESVVHGAEAAYHGFIRVWHFLTVVAQWLLTAWGTLWNGVSWFATQAEVLAHEIFGTIWHVAFSIIPNLAKWVYNNVIRWAFDELVKLADEAYHWVSEAVRWAERELHRAVRDLRGFIGGVVNWAKHAVWWVEHHAHYVLFMLTHPEKLVLLIVDHIVWPIVKWILRSGASIIVWLLKDAAGRGNEIEHFLEDVLHDML